MARARLHGDAIGSVVQSSTDADWKVRRDAVRELCTCHVRADNDAAFTRILELFDDPDNRVRRNALHSMTDSTPATRVDDVVSALEARYSDPDPSLRRRIRKTLSVYRRTGHITDKAG